MREVDSVFDTLVTTFYKNKVLSLIPDLVFTLETTRLSKAVIISQKLLEIKHKSNLRKGLDRMRRNVTRYNIRQGNLGCCYGLDKANIQESSHKLALNILNKIFIRKENIQVFHKFNSWKF